MLVKLPQQVHTGLGAQPAEAMVGNPILPGDARPDGLDHLIDVDRASSVRETFSSQAFWVVGIMLSALAILAFVVFLRPRGRFLGPLMAVAYFGLAVFPAAHIVRIFEFWRWDVTGAHVFLYATAAVLALLAWRVPGPHWAGGVGLLLLTLVLFTSDALFGGPLQVNGVFGHSPLVAGRFYGVSNPGYAILFSAAVLGLTGLAELRRQVGGRGIPVVVTYATDVEGVLDNVMMEEAFYQRLREIYNDHFLTGRYYMGQHAIDLLDLDADTFLRQYDAYLMAKNVGRAREQRHYRTFVGSDSHENLQVI